MDDLHSDITSLQKELSRALGQLNFAVLDIEEVKLRDVMNAADFWQDTQRAQVISQRQATLERRLTPWRALQKELKEAAEMAELKDDSLVADIQKQVTELKKRFDDLKEELKLSGEYDDLAAILSIHAGAGGTDAQDWASMLLRMYVRYAEKSGWKVTTVDESAGEEAGLKSVTLEIDGDYAYGKLKSEHGVHRLVRLSPFNAESRETSFAKVEVLPKIDRPDALKENQIDEKDLKIDVYRSGGHGGQSVNTTDSAVRITHLPTGLTVAIQNERSQLQNRETAMTILRSRLIQLQLEQHAASLRELKGPNQQAAWGNQIRSYVLHPYKQVKDLRTRYETSDIDAVLDGNLDGLIDAYLDYTLGDTEPT